MLKFDGKKTHIVTGTFIVAVLVETYIGDVPNFDVPKDQALTLIFGALGISTIRDAFRKLIDGFTEWKGL